MITRIVTTTENKYNFDTDKFEDVTSYHLNVVIGNYKKGFVYGHMKTLAHARQIMNRFHNDQSFKKYVIDCINEDREHQARISRIKSTRYSELSTYEKQISELM